MVYFHLSEVVKQQICQKIIPAHKSRCVICKQSDSRFKCGRCHSVTYCGKVCQKKDLKRHKKNCAPVVYKRLDDGRLGLIATKHLKRGDVVCKEKSMMSYSIKKGSKDFLKGQTPQELDSFLRKQLESLKSEEKDKFFMLEEDKFIMKKGRREMNLELKLLAIFMNNLILRETRKENSLLLFFTLSNTSHSCLPNAVTEFVSDDPEGLIIRAVRDIEVGEEIEINYRTARQQIGRPDKCGGLTCTVRFEVLDSFYKMLV